jgi:hypothetical protein
MPAERKRLVGDLLFGFQLLMAWWFTVPQVIRSFSSTAGMTITWSLFCSIFVSVNLFLAIGAYRESRSRKALQVVWVYINWLVLWVAILIPTILHGTWKKSDTTVSWLIVVSVAILMVIRRKESLKATFTEPITRGLISLIVKSVPQLYIAYCIVNAGSNTGLSGITLTIGHITVCTRALEIYFTARQDGWNRKNIGLFISETGNELTWWITTVAWLMYN